MMKLKRPVAALLAAVLLLGLLSGCHRENGVSFRVAPARFSDRGGPFCRVTCRTYSASISMPWRPWRAPLCGWYATCIGTTRLRC